MPIIRRNVCRCGATPIHWVAVCRPILCLATPTYRCLVAIHSLFPLVDNPYYSEVTSIIYAISAGVSH